MYRKKRTRLFIFLFAAVVIFIVGGFSHSFLSKYRNTYLSIKNGEPIKATVHQISGETYAAGEKNKYKYTFTVKGQTYTNTTMGKYREDEIAEFWVRYAVEKGEVKYEKVTQDDETYNISVSYEEMYLKNSRTPTLSMAYAIYFLGGVALIFAAVNAIYVMLYKNLESKGTLTYGLFIEAFASKAGSNRHMAVRYKYKDLDDNWIEAVTPFSYNTLDAEKLMAAESFKVRYKGKRSMIAEDIRGLRL